MRELFDRSTTGCARFTGRSAMLGIRVLLSFAGIVAYFVNNDHLISGTNLGINFVTLLILPILQATQNRDGAALQAKLDELIKATVGARNEMIGLEKKGRR